MKRISKSNLDDIESLKSELTILSNVDNPNIINLIEFYESTTNFDIVMEHCVGGSLHERLNNMLSNNKCFTPDQAALIIKQVVQGLNYAHLNKVVHRDIKLENIIFLDQSPKNFKLKLIDFGLSKYFQQGVQRMQEKLGTLYYIAPEVLKGDYNEKCDIWSCGVLLYLILIGCFPFTSKTQGDNKDLYQKILNVDYTFENKCKQNLIF